MSPLVRRPIFAAFALLACAAAARRADDATISPGRVQTFKPIHYLYATKETTLANIAKDAHNLAHAFNEGIRSGKLKPLGPSVFAFDGMTGDPAVALTMTYGIPVDPDTREIDGYKLKDLPELKAYTILYSGKTAGISAAYTQAYTELAQQGLTPTGISREVMLFWESEDSTNNAFMLQVGVK